MEFTRRKIKMPQSLGEILKNARTKKEVTLDQAEEETKVRARYLSALEEGRYEMLPASVYATGFLAKYADFLGLEKGSLIEQFSVERGVGGYDHTKTMSSHGNFSDGKIMVQRRIREPLFSVTPRFILIAGIIVALVAVLSYITYSVHQFTSPPNLVILAPVSNQTIAQNTTHIIGKTDEEVTLTINGENVVTDNNGNFNQLVTLHAGLNSFEVTSINGLKKQNTKLIKVLANIPEVVMPVTTGTTAVMPVTTGTTAVMPVTVVAPVTTGTSSGAVVGSDPAKTLSGPSQTGSSIKAVTTGQSIPSSSSPVIPPKAAPTKTTN